MIGWCALLMIGIIILALLVWVVLGSVLKTGFTAATGDPALSKTLTIVVIIIIIVIMSLK